MKRLSLITGAFSLALILAVTFLWTAAQAGETNLSHRPDAEVLFTDDFESGAGNWVPQANTAANIAFDGSQVYSITNSGGSTARSTLTEGTVPGTTSWTDYSLQARVNITATGSYYGMFMARYLDSRNYYFMTMRGDGRIQIRRYYNGSSSGRTLGEFNGAITPGTWFTATFELKGNNLRALINGTPLITVTDTSTEAFYTGTVALGVDRATARFDDVLVTDLRTFPLNVEKIGSGDGTVTSVPAGIACGLTCTAIYDANTVVTLEASAGGSSTFAGWAGACSGTGSCQVTMDAARSVTAIFSSPANPMLLVHKDGTGGGVVTSDPAGIDCGATCAAGFALGTPVTLTAAANPDAAFTGWSGEGCTGAGACVVTMDAVKNVTATFTRQYVDLTVTKSGTGNGVVSGALGLDCGGICTVTYPANTVVTLTAVADAYTTFDGWSGAGCGGTGACVVLMDEDKTVDAAFNWFTYLLTANRDGGGGGQISSSPAGIDLCSDPACTASFDHGTWVTLTATADSMSTFEGWQGEACSGTGTCTVTMVTSRTVTATFELLTFPFTVARAGTGTGTVTSQPAGIDCGATCSTEFTIGDVVTLTAVADTGSTFAGWLGAGCMGTDACVIAIDGAKAVTAVFSDAANPMLVVYKNGSGDGTVTSAPPGIDCGAACAAGFSSGQSVTLTAAPAAGSKFVGWCGACSGSGPCVVTMDEARRVSALFADTTNILLDEDFESGADGWTSTAGTWSVVDLGGNHVYSQTMAGGMTRSTAGDTSWTDYSLTARVRPDGKYAKLIVRYLDDTHYYFMALRTDSGKVEIKKFDGGSGSLGLGSVNAGITAGEWYTATFEVVGTTLRGYINGTPVITRTDTSLAHGAIGIGTLDTSAQFDDILVRSLVTRYLLTVAQTGSGTGSVSSTPAGVDCDLNCLTEVAAGTVVTLTATPDPGSAFAGWMGGGCTGTGPCVVTLDGDTTVTAVFSSPGAPMLVANIAGNGGGTVVSDPAGIDCTEDCTAAFTPGAQVTLTATPAADSEFTGWAGACSGMEACAVTMDTAQYVVATFQLLRYPLTVVTDGNAEGLVTSIPAGIDCGITCTAEFYVGTDVMLTAVPADAGVYVNWSEDGCASGESACSAIIDGPKTITVTFSLYQVYMPFVSHYIAPVVVEPLFVSPAGDDANPGTITEPLKTLPLAISQLVPGQVLYLRGGLYELSETITLTAKGNSVNLLKIWAYESEKPVLDFAASPAGARGFLIAGNYWHLKGLEIRYAQDNAIKIEGSHNIVENCSLHHNQDTGLQIGLGSTSSNPGGWIAAFNQVINTDSYRNFDAATNGSNADGFAVKLFPGRGNTFYGCRAWENADDGWDLFETYYPVVIENSWTWHNGDPNLFGDPAGWGGNGNGFKLGGNFNHGAHVVKNCIAFDHLNGSAKGFDQNHNMSGVTVYHSVAWGNGVNFSFPEAPNDGSTHVLQNNVAFSPGTSDTALAAGTVHTHNSWNLPVTADAADFLSLMVGLAQAPRQADGNLPVNDFARLVAGSDLIDQGIDVGIPFLGSAPDLGAFEFEPE
ncbi:MAG: InlB B-repeat-containing protein [Chloroflexota bacterium]